MQILSLILIFLTLTSTSTYGDNQKDGLIAFGNKDFEKAFHLLRPFASKGNADIQARLGQMYQYGQGVKQNYKEAIKLYRLGSEGGNRHAQIALGKMYENGQGSKQDYQEAVKWILKAAQQKNHEALIMGSQVRYHKWIILAGEKGDINAQTFLGASYYLGLNVTRDHTEAIKWYRKAAEQGSVIAQNILGAMSEKGKGISKDYVEANKWFTISTSSGDGYGHLYREKIERRMDPAQIKKSRKLAEEWLNEHGNKP